MTQRRAYLTLLALVLGIVALLVVGLRLAVHYTLNIPAATDDPAGPAAGQAGGAADAAASRRDRIAAAPMLSTTEADAVGGTPALGQLPVMVMPSASSIGPEGIPSGYPRTGEGAAAQLGEILVSVLSAMELEHAQRVEQSWAQPNRGDEPWSVLQLIQAFHRGGQLSGGLPPTASMRVVPAGAQVKGSDGDEWHVVCVLLELTYSYRDVAQLAYGHCERMAWDGARWVIGSGEPAVPGPSTWPRTERAVEAGWLIWHEGA